MSENPVVHVVGAGPGDPRLLTIRGRELLAQADLVVYAGSLVNPQVLEFAPPGCCMLNSHGLSLQKIVEEMASCALKGGRVVRLASGDPSIYGSLQEMTEELRARGVKVKVVPGVSSLAASAAALGVEYTQPGGVQSLVVTRLPGRTPVRAQESLERFAATGASMAVFLSVHKAAQISQRCIRGGLSPFTPVAVVHKASWAEERSWWTSLEGLPALVERENLKGSALVMVLPDQYNTGARSFLYGAEPLVSETQKGFSFTILPVSPRAGSSVAKRLVNTFPSARLLASGALSGRVKEAWNLGVPLVFVGPLGVAVRMVAPLLRSKFSDPPVVVVDIAGSFAVALTGGHHGANRLVREIAQVLGAVPVVTTGTEALGVPSLEELALERGFSVHPKTDALLFNKAMVEGAPVYSLGMGWRRGASAESVAGALGAFLKGLRERPAVLATCEAKAGEAEEVLLPLAVEMGAALVIVPLEVLNNFPGTSPSRAKDKLGVVGVAEPAALSVLPEGELIVPKKVVGDVTLALAVSGRKGMVVENLKEEQEVID